MEAVSLLSSLNILGVYFEWQQASNFIWHLMGQKEQKNALQQILRKIHVRVQKNWKTAKNVNLPAPPPLHRYGAK